MAQRPKKMRLPDKPGHERQAQGEDLAPIASSPQRQTRNPRTVLAVCGLLLVAVALVFGQTARFNLLNFDDNQYLNEQVQRGLSVPGIVWAFTGIHVGNWHPLTTLSLMLDWQLFGLKGGGYHIHNVLLHAITAVLCFFVLERMTGACWPSAAAAAIFAVHPLRAESVAWMTERKDVLSGVFLMLILGAYTRYATRPFSLARYLTVVAVFALGLMTKSMLVTVPALLLFLDYWPLQRFAPAGASAASWRRCFLRLALEKVPLLLLSAGSSLITMLSEIGAIRPIEILPFSVRIAYAPVSCVAYLGQIFYPFDLAPHYPYVETGPPGWQVAVAILVLLAISAAVILARRRYPYFLVGWLWYLTTLLPVIGLVPGGIQLMADRYSYMTQIGLYIACVWAVADVCRPWRYRALACGAVATLVLAALMGCAMQQTSYWHDNQTLWRHTLAVTSNNGFAQEKLGDSLLTSGRAAEAEEHYRMALKITPDSLVASTNLANILLGRGEIDEAVAYFRKAVEVRPMFATAHHNLGVALLRQKNLDGAIAEFRSALDIEPRYAEACNNLGSALEKQGKPDEAITYYRRAAELNPRLAGALYNLGNLLLARGELDDALKSFRQAVAANPGFIEARNNIGATLNRLGQFDAAIAEYERTLALNPQLAMIYHNLGVCWAQKGNPDEAIRYFQKGLALASAQGNTELADTFRERVRQLQASLPSRDATRPPPPRSAQP